MTVDYTSFRREQGFDGSEQEFVSTRVFVAF